MKFRLFVLAAHVQHADLEIGHLSCPAIKQTLPTLRKVSDRISLCIYTAQVYPDIHFSPPVGFLFQEVLLYTPETECLGPDQFAQADLDRYITQRP